ncbi:TetR family transcriptional regulator [Thermovibrio guaymasensis]|uniref:TetR family transcriptional regulator n=1 Tax=Thermovibrio guaymasensis TaxID=240167 RepID=A0A420W8I3_9BACT|nr:TetR/AcrR family transcriptional regulator [Thermovibrio guaymasensis]RKQ63630.1 TetR family transcriptional regulator [Thermovibrio guaymasensis]
MKKREEEILVRAKSLFSKRGFHSLTVSEIVDSLGIARGTFYLYFKNKDDVYRRVLERTVQEIEKNLKVLPLERPLEQLRRNLLSVLKLIEEDRETASLIFYHPYKLNLEFDEILEEFYGKVLSLIERALLKGMEMGIVRECNVKVISRAIFGAFVEVGKGLLKGELQSAEEAVDELLSFGLRGLLEGRNDWRN